MSRDKTHKIKLLKLWELLSQDSDSEHRLSTAEIMDRLSSIGIECDRRTVYDDVRTLNEYGYEVMQDRSRANLYYVEDRKFDVPELKILIDAVEASSFITSKKSRELIAKIAALGGSHRAELLKKNSIEYNANKHSNETIYYTVMTIDEAISDKLKIRFRYFDTDVLKRKVLRKNGEFYTVNPCSMIYDNNNYYLVCYDDKHKSLSHYRIDRMLNVAKTDNPIEIYPHLTAADVKEYVKQVFGMYTGRKTTVKMRAELSLVDAVIDKFGECVNTLKYDDESFVFYADVQLSPMFYSWCFSLGGKISILEPPAAIGEYESMLKSALDAISEGAPSDNE